MNERERSAPAIRSSAVRTPGVNRGQFAATSWWGKQSCETSLRGGKSLLAGKEQGFYLILGWFIDL